MTDQAATDQAAWLKTAGEGDRMVVAFGGRWGIEAGVRLDSALRGIAPGKVRAVRLDIAAVDALDTVGATILHRTRRRLRDEGYAAEFVGAAPEQALLLDLVAANDTPVECRPPREPTFRAMVAGFGAAVVEQFRITRLLIGFLGVVTLGFLRILAKPSRLRGKALVSHMEKAGLNAVPIVCLIAFLIGVVLAYQSADQLRRFGAEIFVINLVGVSILREIGILLTAIVIAGRSGSAFTAAIGSMKVREEIDAMRTLGVDPIEVLVMPRIIALVITLPLLTFIVDIVGLAGGGLMCWLGLGIPPGQFIERLGDAVPLWSFWIGIIKAPVFAFLIALVGCFEGFQVEGSAESVGSHTTRAVVEAIFLVIVVDAMFSIMFSYIGV